MSRSSNTEGCSSKTQYNFTVTTNDGYKDAGTLSKVYIKIVGDKAGNPVTKWLHLHGAPGGDFCRGQTSTYNVNAIDVGKPLILNIEKFFGKSLWACDRITVEYQAEEFIFPIEDFITDKVSVTRGKAYASGKVPDEAVVEMRALETANSKDIFKWIGPPIEGQIGWGLTRYLGMNKHGNLPAIFQWTTKRLSSFTDHKMEPGFNLVTDRLSTLHSTLTNFDSYSELYKHLHNSENPVFFDCWKTDEEFGRQKQLNGVSPLSFHRCSEIPENCQITENDVKDFLRNSLADEMKAGKIYLADYSKVFQGVPKTKNSKGENLYCPDAFCLYYVNSEKNFVPVAIQLVPDDENTIFTPADGEDAWLLAKMYFKVALGNLHEGRATGDRVSFTLSI